MASHGLSNLALGKAIGVSHTSVGDWILGAKPRARIAKRLADFFGISVEDLMDDSRPLPAEEPPPSGVSFATAAPPAGDPSPTLVREKQTGTMTQWMRQEFVKRVSPDDPLFAQLEALVFERFGEQVRQLDERAEELRKRSEQLEAVAGRVDATLEKLERIVSKYGMNEADVQKMIAAEIAKGGRFVVVPESIEEIEAAVEKAQAKLKRAKQGKG